MKIVTALLLIIMLPACEPAAQPAGGTPVSVSTKPQLEADLATMRQARIFFSHHSVGENILTGIARVVAESGATPLRITSLEQAATFPGPALLHGSGGQNKDPESKIAFFDATLRSSPNLRPDIAVMKFCYVDFNPSTDVDKLFGKYRRAIEALKREHPGVRFAHVTVPLVPRTTDLKSWVRRLLGLQEWGDASNAKRHAFNRKLAETFAGDPVFDLARIESTESDGRRVSFQYDGQAVPSMAQTYNADNGHLNLTGQRLAGTAAIGFFAQAFRSRSVAVAGTGGAPR